MISMKLTSNSYSIELPLMTEGMELQPLIHLDSAEGDVICEMDDMLNKQIVE